MPFGQLGVFEYHLCLSGHLSLPERTVRERFVNGPVRERGGHDQLKYERTVHERFTNGHVRERVVCTGKFRERTHERTNTNGSFKRSLNANMNGQHCQEMNVNVNVSTWRLQLSLLTSTRTPNSHQQTPADTERTRGAQANQANEATGEEFPRVTSVRNTRSDQKPHKRSERSRTQAPASKPACNHRLTARGQRPRA